VQGYSELSVSELVKLCCEQRTPQLWEEFVRRFHPTIAGVVMRRARKWNETRPEVVAELVQDVYLKLCADDCRILRKFAPSHPEAFFGFLKVISVNFVNDHFKALLTNKRRTDADVISFGQLPQEPASAAGQTWSQAERDILCREIDSLLRRVLEGQTAERDRTIFWLYYRTGMTASAIASLPSIDMNPKSVESVIHRLTQLLRDELKSPENTSSARGLEPDTSF
jgi:RNA polymerase sigma-70 factor (ECF subfamily)